MFVLGGIVFVLQDFFLQKYISWRKGYIYVPTEYELTTREKIEQFAKRILLWFLKFAELLYNETTLPFLFCVYVPFLELILSMHLRSYFVAFAFLVLMQILEEALRLHQEMPSLGKDFNDPKKTPEWQHWGAVFLALTKHQLIPGYSLLLPLAVDGCFQVWLPLQGWARFIFQIVSLMAGLSTVHWSIHLKVNWGYGGPTGCYNSDGNLVLRG